MYRSIRTRSAEPGQGLVEFAILLPLLALLLVMTIDFGRVFFGWVAIQNAARIGADQASQTASAWPTAENDDERDWQDAYQSLITYDLGPFAGSCPSPHGDPTFTDVNGGTDHDFGDLVTVRLECSFDLITPLAEDMFGGPVPIAAESTFAIHRTEHQDAPDPPEPPADPCGAPVAAMQTDPAPGNNGRVEGTGSVVVDFFDDTPSTADCPITAWSWNMGDGSPPVTTQDVLDKTFTYGGQGGSTTYVVRLTVTNDDGMTDDVTIQVRVNRP